VALHLDYNSCYNQAMTKFIVNAESSTRFHQLHYLDRRRLLLADRALLDPAAAAGDSALLPLGTADYYHGPDQNGF
jgi:hypothetical protein